MSEDGTMATPPAGAGGSPGAAAGTNPPQQPSQVGQTSGGQTSGGQTSGSQTSGGQINASQTSGGQINASQIDQLNTFVREQPLAAVLAALIFGYFLGKIT